MKKLLLLSIILSILLSCGDSHDADKTTINDLIVSTDVVYDKIVIDTVKYISTMCFTNEVLCDCEGDPTCEKCKGTNVIKEASGKEYCEIEFQNTKGDFLKFIPFSFEKYSSKEGEHFLLKEFKDEPFIIEYDNSKVIEGDNGPILKMSAFKVADSVKSDLIFEKIEKTSNDEPITNYSDEMFIGKWDFINDSPHSKDPKIWEFKSGQKFYQDNELQEQKWWVNKRGKWFLSLQHKVFKDRKSNAEIISATKNKIRLRSGNAFWTLERK